MLNVLLHSLQNATPSQRAFADEAVATLEGVLNDPAFLPLVLGGTYSSRQFQPDANALDDLVDLPNDGIVTLIQTGKEYQQAPNDTVDISVALDDQLERRVMGGSTPPDPLITTNISFFDNWQASGDALSLAAHWFHEWLHVAGLRHVSRHPDFADAVYQIGDMVVTVGQQQAPPATALVADKVAAAPAARLGESYRAAIRAAAEAEV